MFYGPKGFCLAGNAPPSQYGRLRLGDRVLVRGNEIEVQAWRKSGVFEHAFCKVVVSLLPDCTVGMDIVCHWECSPFLELSNRVPESALQAMLTGLVKGSQ